MNKVENNKACPTMIHVRIGGCAANRNDDRPLIDIVIAYVIVSSTKHVLNCDFIELNLFCSFLNHAWYLHSFTDFMIYLIDT